MGVVADPLPELCPRIVLPRTSALGDYRLGKYEPRLGEYQRAIEIDHNESIWPFRFACMNCKQECSCSVDKIQTLPRLHQEYEALARSLNSKQFCQLQIIVEIKNGPARYAADYVYTIAEKSMTDEDLLEAVRGIIFNPESVVEVGPDLEKILPAPQTTKITRFKYDFV